MTWRRTDVKGSAAVLRCIADAPQDVAAIAAALDLHPNTVRKHLDRLRREGLVEDELVHTGEPGRPSRIYRRTARPADAYERLALLLVELHRTGETPIELGRRLGAVESAGATSARAAVATVSSAHGLAAVVEGSDVVLTTCPFSSAVAVDARTVCDLHLGLAQGAAGSTDVTVQPGTPCRFHLPEELT